MFLAQRQLGEINMEDIFILIVEIVGTVAFAISGATVAIKNKLDLLGVIILGCITACGGGMIRDVMLTKVPSMFDNPLYLIIAFVTSVTVFLFSWFLHKKELPLNSFLIICDGLGLGVFVVLGAQETIMLGYKNPLIVIFMGVLTGVGGGIVRDLLVCNIPFILRKHIYAVAAMVGGIVYYLFYRFNWHLSWGAILSIIIVVIIRILASTFKWSLPKIKDSEIDLQK